MNNNTNPSCPETILIIDDNPDHLNLLSIVLAKAKYKVHLFSSGKLGLKFIQSHLPDLILLDIVMSEMDGYEVYTQLKNCEKTRDIPVIFISPLQDLFDKVKAFSLGAADYITKPFQEQEVLIRVENQLRYRRLSKQLIYQNISQERNRMAREIHDTLAQAFTGIIVHLAAAERAIKNYPEQTLLHIQIVQELAKNGLIEARHSVEELRPKLLEDGDLYIALKRITTQMFSYTDTSTVFEVIGIPYTLPLEVENNLLRIAQEALTNAFKYAKANTIRIELTYESAQFFLKVQDDGRGFDMSSYCFRNGFGFLGMTERADRIGAKLTVNSKIGEGTEVIVLINLIANKLK